MTQGIRAITLPKWGLSMEEGTLVEWQMEVGADLQPGDEIAHIETDKIAGPVEVQVGGILKRKVAAEGDVLPVGALLAVVADAAVDDEAIDAFVAQFQQRFVPGDETGDDSDAAPKTIEHGGGLLAYIHAPEAEESGAIPLVLIHGFGGDRESWIFNSLELAKDRHVYAIDLPGHGESSKEVGDGSLEVLADSVEAFLNELAIDCVHLAGHSLGAAVALAFAQRAPKRVVSIAGIAPCGVGGTVNPEYTLGFTKARRRRDMKPVLELLFGDPASVTKQMVEGVLKYKRLDGVEAALDRIAQQVFPGGIQTSDFRPFLAQSHFPFLCIAGSMDRIVAFPATDGVQTVFIERAGHMPHMEAASECNRLLQEHMARAERSI